MNLLLLVDTREQNPLLFPKTVTYHESGTIRRASVVVQKSKLSYGDYALENFRSACVIERKGSIMEVTSNCLTKDRARFEAALTRLATSCSHPVLFFEGDTRSLLRGTTRSDAAEFATDCLLQLLLQHKVQLLCCKTASFDDRRLAGELVLRTLLAGSRLSCPVPSSQPS